MLEGNYIYVDVYKSHVPKMKRAFELRIGNTRIIFHFYARRAACATPQ